MSSYSTERSADRTEALPTLALDGEVLRLLRRLLYELASQRDTTAADQAATVPYWKPCPQDVIGTRAAARVIRDLADGSPQAPRGFAR